MFGFEYYKHPEVLLSSFKEMNENYKKRSKKQNNILIFLQKIYIFIFGIPEIGFQVRDNYFKATYTKYLENNKFKKILDAGSGIGTYAIWLSKKNESSQIDGWEIDKDKINFTKSFVKELGLKNINIMYKDLTGKTTQRNEYDLIVNIDVLEHIKDYKNVLNNFYKLLTKGGFLFIHTPQINQKRIFSSLENWHHEGHVQEGYSPKNLTFELKKIGFQVVELRQTFGFFGKLAWELDHIFMSKGLILAGVFYPFLYLVSLLDLTTKNKNGLGTAIIVKK